MVKIRHLLCLLWALSGLVSLPMCAPASAATQHIQNTATFSFSHNGSADSVISNTTTLDVDLDVWPTAIKFYRMPKDFDYSDLTCVAGPPVGIHAAPVDAATLATMSEDSDATDPDMAVVLQAPNSNRDPAARETVTIIGSASTGQSGTVILTETGPNTGIFAGGLYPTAPTGHAQACLPVFPANTRFSASFPGDSYSTPSENSILIDPYGHVFDSVTGDRINGAIVSIVNDATGQLAAVYGDDGVTVYPSQVTSGQDVTDAGGTVYKNSDGDYRFPMLEAGTYHLIVKAPDGYTAPSTVAPADLPTGSSGAYVISDASYGKPFVLSSPEPLQVDIPLDPIPHGALLIQKTASLREASPGDVIAYHLSITNPEISVTRKSVITDTLPAGLRYKRGTTSGVDEPEVSADGRTLTFTLATLATNQTIDVRYGVEVMPAAPVGDAVNSAVIQITGGPASAVASAHVRIQPLLFTDAMTIVGRVTDGGCEGGSDSGKGVANVRLLLDDGTYVMTDRDGLYHFEGLRKGRHVVALDTTALSEAWAPVVCQDDTRWAGSTTSRFVEGDGGSLKRVDFRLKATGKAAAEEEALPIKVMASDIAAGGRTQWLLGQAPGIDWLFPDVDHNPRAPALRVAIKHYPGQRVALTVNGKPTDPLAFDSTDKSDDVAVSLWTGLPLVEGDNVLEARVLDASGAAVKTLTRTVHYANTPLQATYVPELSRLVADGRTRPLIAVRLTDRDGKPVRDGAMAAFHIDQPYSTAQAAQAEQSRQLSGLDRADTFVRITGDNGMAFIALEPTTQAGEAHITFELTQDKTTRKSDIRAWLEADQKDWVVVGFAQGTAGFDTLTKNTHRYWLPKDRDITTSGQLSLYAKGRVKGKWLLTLAYDSDHSYDPDSGLLSGIDPDKYYTVYGDGTRQAYDAATSRKLYLRLERKDAYVMLGDFETGLKDTQLGRFSRTLNGLKAGYHGKHIEATGFAARSDQRYARDEIQGNGLSGPYRLSAGGLISNSDQVTLETRDRFRPEKIIESRLLTRHIDYDIDPDAGTLTFREPVLARDADFNPIYIVVDYEVEGTGDKRLVAGGRVSAKIKDRLEIGATVLRDDSQSQATVAGLDMKAQVGKSLEVRAEAAGGGRRNAGDNTAFLIEAEHRGTRSQMLAYVRQQDEGFGVGQQNITEAGTRKLGIDGQIRLTDIYSLSVSAWRQQSLVDTSSRIAGDIKLERRHKNGTLFIEATTASDEGMGQDTTTDTATSAVSSTKQSSQIIGIGGTQSLMHDKLQLSGQVQLALGGADDNSEYPVRQSIAAAYKLTDSVRLIAGHEVANGAGLHGHTSRIGFDLTPWHGAKLMTTLNQLALGENGARSFSQMGLNQSLPIGQNWTVDATLDSSQTMSGHIKEDAVNPFQPITTGQALNDSGNYDYTSATLGATYRASNWSWNGRAEVRRSDVSNRTGLTSNLIRALGEGKTVASSLRIYHLTDSEGRKAELASADISLAWRPLDSRWSVLERLELRHNRADADVKDADVLGITVSTGENQVTTRLINNIALNYTADHGIEASVYYGAKLIRGKLADDAYDGFIDAIGADIRKSLGKRFDIAFSLSRQLAHNSGVSAMSYGPSIGFSPKKDVWISVGYNIAGYHDPDTDGSHYTEQGPYITARVKFDANTLRNIF
ncbi:MAG: hypothetical protein QM647_14165 [Asticcacaulis sp.]|uniref:hypothetical protein n=1 Tax=Asticcacaulis sp. TaxID=1872648 RepID=UPI0039E59D03